DQKIQTAKSLDRLMEETLHLLFIGHVCRDGDCTRSVPNQGFGQRSQLLSVASCKNQICAFIGEGLCDTFSDTATCARDQCDFVFELPHPCLRSPGCGFLPPHPGIIVEIKTSRSIVRRRPHPSSG